MKTVVKTADQNSIHEAAAILQKGGLVAFQTETVYGLGANALDANAVSGIFTAKGRPQDNPLIIHIAAWEDLDKLAANVPPIARRLGEAFWPGPMTMVFKKTKMVPLNTSGGLDTVAVRFPAAETALRLIRAAGVPLAAPSANVSGRPSPTEAAHVVFDLDGKIDMVLDGGSCLYGLESTVVDVTAEPVCLLRPGSVTREMLEVICGEVNVAAAVTEKDADEGFAPKAPGMKYTHYAPLAALTIVNGAPQTAADYIRRLTCDVDTKIGILASDQTISGYDHEKTFCISAGDRERPEMIAAGLYAALRHFDREGVAQIYAESFAEDGIGLAIMNRLKKAAGFTIIDV